MDKDAQKIVNYVWINKSIFPPKDTADKPPLCGIKLHEVERALSNAQKYPDAQFKIWVDWRYLDIMSRFLLESQVYFSGCGNFQIHSLEKIPQYAMNTIFKPNSGIKLLAKVDYARLLVLDHVLESNQDAFVYYSDMDCEDVMLNDSKCQESMKRDGTVMANVKNMYYENGFFGFTKKGQYFLNTLKTETKKCAKHNTTGYGSLGHVIKIFFPHGSHRKLCQVKLTQTNIKMEKPEYYSKHNIC